MIRFRLPRIARHIAFGAVAVLTLPVLGQQLRLDRSKSEIIELAFNNVVRESTPVGPAATTASPPDPGERRIESSTKRVVAVATQTPQSSPPRPNAVSGNPTVKPGEVIWHASFA